MPNQYPLSHAQERFWLLDQINPGNPAYNLAAAFRIEGRLDQNALERSVDFICARQESLRTVFESTKGIPHQKVHASLHLEIETIDLTGITDDAVDTTVAAAISDKARRPFDLARGPLTRFLVIRSRINESFLLICQHHIVSDAGSLTLLLGELSAGYTAFILGELPKLETIALPYTQHSVRQRKSQGDHKEQQGLAYWEAQLSECPILDLPTDRPRPKTQTFEGGYFEQRLGGWRLQQLRTLAANSKVTLFMLLLSAFKLLISKHAGQNDVVVGTPIEGRNRSDIESVQGLFLNTLAIRTKFPENPTFESLLQAVKERALEAYSHSEVPFERIIEALQPPRDPSRTPFFQVMLNMFTDSVQRLELSDLHVEPYALDEAFSKFDITLYLSLANEELRVRWAYNRDLFDRERIEAMSSQLVHLLDQILVNPKTPLGDLSLITAAAMAALPDPRLSLHSTEFPLVAAMVGKWSEKAPATPAISLDGNTWSYGKLSTSSNEIAHKLVSAGVNKGDVVAMTGRPSHELIASMLGTWLAGGVVMPISAEFPSAHKIRMLETANAKFLVSPDTSEVAWAQCVTVLNTGRSQWDSDTSLPDVRADDSAYVFFTSGTTGTPKGILGNHNGLSHFLLWQQDAFAVSPNDRFAQTANLSFDVMLRDVFLPLTSGATLVLPPKHSIELDFLDWLIEERITRLHTVPSILRFWLSEYGKKKHERKHLKTIFSAGEPLDSALIERIRELVGERIEIVNLYGPTETTLAKSHFRVPDTVMPGVQPIGRAIPQSQLLILNTHDKLCGLFERGEICIRTPFKTNGYLNSPEDTFIQNPLNDDSRDFIYRSGDVGWYLSDGNVAIAGRKDDQVKIRGVRVEPSAASNVLAKHPDLQSNVVLPIEIESNEYCLTAFVVPGSSTVSVEQLLKYLHDQLPSIYVPTAVAFLEELPLTSNGKIDKAALPTPVFVSAVSDQHELPGNAIEEELVKIWEDVFHLESVGMLSTFFEMGGHSLLAVQLLNRIREAFQIELSLTRFFENPSVRDVAIAIGERLEWNGPARPAPAH